MKRTPISHVYLHQSIDINGKKEFTLTSDTKLFSRRKINYEMFWTGNELQLVYDDGALEIIPVGNIKKMVVDQRVEEQGESCQEPKPRGRPRKVEMKPESSSKKSFDKDILTSKVAPF